MSSQTKKPVRPTFDGNREERFDLDTLLHPAGAFVHPADVLRDPTCVRRLKETLEALVRALQEA